MGKLEDYTRNRMEGLAWALSIIDKEENVEQGVENLRKEVRFRKAVFVPLEIPRRRIREVNEMLARRMLNVVLVTVIKVLDDEYGWKKKRLSKFITKFTKHAIGFEDMDPYGDHYIEISDYAQWFNEQYGAMFSPEAVEEMVQVERENRAAHGRRVQVEAVERILKNSHPKAWEYLKEQIGA